MSCYVILRLNKVFSCFKETIGWEKMNAFYIEKKDQFTWYVCEKGESVLMILSLMFCEIQKVFYLAKPFVTVVQALRMFISTQKPVTLVFLPLAW